MEIELGDWLSLPISWQILKHISSNGDKKRLRQVCRNWRTAIDQLIGLELKLTPKNKAKMFASHIISQCTSIAIEGGSGTLPWYTCPFYKTKLRKVAINGEITVDNWRLLMEKCESIEKMTIVFQKEPKEGSNKILAWNSWSQTQQYRIDHNNLTRLFIKGAFDSLQFQCNAIINILRTISIPHLCQLVFTKDAGADEPILEVLMNYVREMKQSCHLLKTFGFVDWYSKYSNMNYWDTLWVSRKDALVIHGSCWDWRQVIDLFHEDTNLNEVHYDIIEETEDYLEIDNYILKTGINSKNIQTLSLRPTTFGWPIEEDDFLDDIIMDLNCASLSSLMNLRTLEIKLRVEPDAADETGELRFPSLHNFELPPLLEKVSLWTIPVTNEILVSILQCLRIQEICIRDQNPRFETHTLTGQNIDTAINHATLKFLVLDSSCEPRVRQVLSILDQNVLEDQQWSILRQKNQPPRETTKSTFEYLPEDYAIYYSIHNRLNRPPSQMLGRIQLAPNIITTAMTLVNLKNANEAQLLEFKNEYN